MRNSYKGCKVRCIDKGLYLFFLAASKLYWELGKAGKEGEGKGKGRGGGGALTCNDLMRFQNLICSLPGCFIVLVTFYFNTKNLYHSFYIL